MQFWLFCVIFVVIIVALLYIWLAAKQFNTRFTNRLETNVAKAKELPEFSYDLVLPNPPQNIVITNEYACTLDELRTCSVSDPTSCFGCQNLTAACQHFDTDQLYTNAKGETTTIPANTSPDEGYCLVVQRLFERCNPFHGNLVFVQRSPNSNELALICDCKNPGYIGNLTIDGACETVFVCNGKIDDVNKPLEEIECKCEESQQPTRINNVPTCRIKSVDEATGQDYGNLMWPVSALPTSMLSQNLAGNFNSDRFINPCQVCILTGAPVDGELFYSPNEESYFCRNRDYSSLPVRRHKSYRILRGSFGPDGMINLPWIGYNYYGHMLGTENPRGAIIVDPNMVGERMRKLMNFTRTTGVYYIDAAPHDLVFRYTLYLRINNLPGTNCWREGAFRYDCGMHANEGGATRVEIPMRNVTNTMDPMFRRTVNNPPALFLFGQLQWLIMQQVNPMIDVGNSVDGVPDRYKNHGIYNDMLSNQGDSFMRQIKFLYVKWMVNTARSRYIGYLVRTDKALSWGSWCNARRTFSKK